MVVDLLRGFGRKMLTMYVFGRKLLTCSPQHSRQSNFSTLLRIVKLPECDHELTRIWEICTLCPRCEGLDGNCGRRQRARCSNDVNVSDG